MYLVKTDVVREESTVEGVGSEATILDHGFAGWLVHVAGWWRRRMQRDRRRQARKRLFLVESLMLGPKQRVVLLRCGGEQFLVGTGPEGIQSIVPVGKPNFAAPLVLRGLGEKQCG